MIESAGVSRYRDAVDVRVLDDVKQRRYRPYLRSQADVRGWPELPELHRPSGWDSDQDGMPDAWERKHRLSPDDPSDAASDPDGDEYTALEHYLNQLPQ